MTSHGWEGPGEASYPSSHPLRMMHSSHPANPKAKPDRANRLWKSLTDNQSVIMIKYDTMIFVRFFQVLSWVYCFDGCCLLVNRGVQKRTTPPQWSAKICLFFCTVNTLNANTLFNEKMHESATGTSLYRKNERKSHYVLYLLFSLSIYYTPCPRKKQATLIFAITSPSVEIFLQFSKHFVQE